MSFVITPPGASISSTVVTLAGFQNIPSFTVSTINFDQIFVNDGSYNLANPGVFSPVKKGIYAIMFSALLADGTSSAVILLHTPLNAPAFTSTQSFRAGSGSFNFTIQTTVPLFVGDTIKCNVFNITAFDITISQAKCSFINLGPF